jgi:hypothetical protein
VATSLAQLYSRLLGDIPGLPLARAVQAVQDAWADICASRLWSFSVQEVDLNATNITSDGLATVTPFSSTVTGDATAATAWATLNATYPLTTLQFRSGLGEVYNVTVYNGSNTITLDRPFVPIGYPASPLTQAYQLYKCYFSVTPPDGSTFLCWESVIDPVQGYALRRVGYRKQDIDRYDPLRNSFGNPVFLASYKLDANGNQIWEMWPHPMSAQSYLALYRTNGKPLVSPGDTLPATVSRNLVEERAMIFAIRWAMSNPGQVPSGDKIRWGDMLKIAEAEYKDQLIRASVDDDEHMLSYWVKFNPLSRVPGILTGAWGQSHDLYGLAFGFGDGY